MKEEEKKRFGVRKFLIIVVAAVIVILAAVVAGVHLYLNGDSFRARLEEGLSAELEKEICIGSLTVGLLSGVRAADIEVRGPGGEGLVTVPEAEVAFTPGGLLSGRVDSVTVKGPRVVVRLSPDGRLSLVKKRGEKDGGEEAPDDGSKGAEEPGALPFTVESVRVLRANIVIKPEEERELKVGPLDMEMTDDGTGLASIVVSTAVPFLEDEVRIDTLVDLNNLSVERGRVELGEVKLGTLLSGRGESSSVPIGGTLSSALDIAKGKRGALIFTYTGNFRDVTASLLGRSTGRIKARTEFSRDFGSIAVDMNIDADTSMESVAGASKLSHSLFLKGNYFARKGEFRIRGGRVESPLLGRLSLDGRVRGLNEEEEPPDLDIKLSSIDWEGVRLKDMGIHLFALLGIVPEGTELDGTISWEAAVTGTTEKVECAVSAMMLGVSFSTLDGEVMADGLGAVIETGLTYSTKASELGFKFNGKTEGLELLYGRFYGDFLESDVKVFARGRYDLKGERLLLSSAGGTVAGIGGVDVSGVVTEPLASQAFELDVKVEGLLNGPFFDFFIRETFAESVPVLAEMELAGITRLSAKAKGTPEAFVSHGTVSIEGASAADGASLKLDSINADLPFEIAYPDPKAAKAATGGWTAEKTYGRLRIGSVRAGDLQIEGFSVEPALSGNRLTFKDELELALLGGNVTLSDVDYSDVLSDERELKLSIDIEGLELEEIAAIAGLPTFGGTLSGKIPSARLKGMALSTEGGIKLKLFGGEIEVGKIAAENLFSPISSLKGSIKVSDIDLALVTEAFEFGRITGVMSGYVKELVVTGGEPQSFAASFATKKVKGVKQEVSVKALKKISIFGSGGAGEVLSSGVHRFFDEYKYSKMGFSGTLKNDTFLLKGVETEGGKGYLVKGAVMPPRVDVVSYSQKVSFKEMVERLKRIEAVDSEEGAKKKR